MTQLRTVHVGCVFSLFYFVRTECSRVLQLFVFSVIREAHAIFANSAGAQDRHNKSGGSVKSSSSSFLDVHDLASFVNGVRRVGPGGRELAGALLIWLAEEPVEEGDALFSLLQDARALLGEAEGQYPRTSAVGLFLRRLALEAQKASFESLCALSEAVEKERQAITFSVLVNEPILDGADDFLAANEDSCRSWFSSYEQHSAHGRILEAAASLRACHVRLQRSRRKRNEQDPSQLPAEMHYVLLALAGLYYKGKQYETAWQFVGEANRAAQEACDHKGLVRCLFQSALVQIQQGLFARAQASLRACGERACAFGSATKELEVLAWGALARLVASRPHLLQTRAFLEGSSAALPGGQAQEQEPKVAGIVPGGFTVPAAPYLDHSAIGAHRSVVIYHTLSNQASFRSSVEEHRAELLAGQSLVFCVAGQRGLAEATARIAERIHKSSPTRPSQFSHECPNSDGQRQAFEQALRTGDFVTCQTLVKEPLEDRAAHVLQKARLSLARGDFVAVVDQLDAACTFLTQDILAGPRRDKYYQQKNIVHPPTSRTKIQFATTAMQQDAHQRKAPPQVGINLPVGNTNNTDNKTRHHAQKWRVDLRVLSSTAEELSQRRVNQTHDHPQVQTPVEVLHEKRRRGCLVYRDHLTVQDVALAHTLIADAHLGCRSPMPAALACGRALLMAHKFGLQEARARALSRVARMHFQLEDFNAAQRSLNEARALLVRQGTGGSELSGYIEEVAADISLSMSRISVSGSSGGEDDNEERGDSSQQHSAATRSCSASTSTGRGNCVPDIENDDLLTSSSDSGSDITGRRARTATKTAARGTRTKSSMRRQKFRRHIDASLKTTYVPVDHEESFSCISKWKAQEQQNTCGMRQRFQRAASVHLLRAVEIYAEIDDFWSLNRVARELAFLYNDMQDTNARDKIARVVRCVSALLKSVQVAGNGRSGSKRDEDERNPEHAELRQALARVLLLSSAHDAVSGETSGCLLPFGTAGVSKSVTAMDVD
ncbi:unnamed protein product [Amoebophrya sp. A25]|nr:unnamed protein product [Amoebophrya sp. A25]|eukprot:GSA25T00001794001.1